MAAAHGLDIFDVELRREGGQHVLRVIVDRPGPAATPEDSVSIEDCARVSRGARARCSTSRTCCPSELHARGVVAGPGSAAAARRRLPAVRRAAGEDRDARAGGPANGVRRAAAGMEGDDVLFESEGGKLVRLPLRLISRARLEVEF